MIEQADPPPISEGLTALQIDELVAQYRREMARYEKTAALVGEKLRRELRSAGIKHMVSHRPKHPEDLAKKLEKKAKEKPDVYSLENLRRNLNDVVTDLAGCRVIVYWSSDEQEVVRRVQATFAQPARADAEPSVRRGLDTAYWATHVLVHPYAPSGERDDPTVDEAICELQIVTVAAHLYNEIEHDIAYKVKMRGGPADEAEKQILDELRGVARVADRLVDELMKHRRDRDDDATRVISDEEELRYAFQRIAGRAVAGEFARLLRVLEQVVERVTVETLRGSVRWTRSSRPAVLNWVPPPTTSTKFPSTRSACGVPSATRSTRSSNVGADLEPPSVGPWTWPESMGESKMEPSHEAQAGHGRPRARAAAFRRPLPRGRRLRR